MFTNNSDTRPAFDRNPLIGFRCIKVSVRFRRNCWRPATQRRDYSNVKPVSDEIYRAYLNQFTYDRTDPAARLEATEETPGWKKEEGEYCRDLRRRAATRLRFYAEEHKSALSNGDLFPGGRAPDSPPAKPSWAAGSTSPSSEAGGRSSIQSSGDTTAA
jgi:hypothetical protein